MSDSTAIQHVGLIGWPVAHSLSPAMFNAAFTHLDMPWRYTAHAIPPETLAEQLPQLRIQGLRGFNVTVPHKQAVLPFLSVVRPEAQAVGAVNTVIARPDGTWEGANTDVTGFAADLLHHLGMPKPGSSAVVLGAGGAARAAALALVQQGYAVYVASRRVESASALNKDVLAGLADTPAEHRRLEPVPWNKLPEVASGSALIVNCTPVGMWPQVDASPWPENNPFPQQVTVYDMVYRPRETALMRQALAAGGQAIDGLGMLVRQGAAAFEHWTGLAAPVEIMRHAAEQALH